MYNICVFSSGGGGNFQSLIDQSEILGYNVSRLVCDRDCGAILRAQNHKIDFIVLDRNLLSCKFFCLLEEAIPINTDLIVLAGFMPIIPGWFVDKWYGKMINIHPSLLPDHGGLGMYGVHVQESVLDNCDAYAGCTVHFVSSEIDKGEIIAQTKISVYPSESAWDLGGRVFNEEIKLLPFAVKQLMDGRISQ